MKYYIGRIFKSCIDGETGALEIFDCTDGELLAVYPSIDEVIEVLYRCYHVPEEAREILRNVSEKDWVSQYEQRETNIFGEQQITMYCINRIDVSLIIDSFANQIRKAVCGIEYEIDEIINKHRKLVEVK